MLQITNLTTELINDLNLVVEPNQVIAITGDNGSGKSTLAKTIAGYYQVTSGSVSVAPEAIGLLTQNPYLQFIGNTVFDELTYSLEQSATDHEAIQAVLDNSPFDLQSKLNELSGGQAQRLLIYKEMVSDKDVLILDETLSNLDNMNKLEIIEQLKASGKAIILITNNLNDTKFADAVYKLKNSRLQLVTQQFAEVELLENDNCVTVEYEGYQFKSGLNLVTGQSAGGKSTLITNLCFELQQGISLIPQYPFEIVTTIDSRHLYDQQLAEQFGLTADNFSQNITELSTGELVKVLVVEAISSDNSILVLDEAIEVLDKQSQQAVLDAILKRFETVIIVTHNQYLFNHRQAHIVEVACNQ